MLEQRDYKNYKELCKAMNWSITGGLTRNIYYFRWVKFSSPVI